MESETLLAGDGVMLAFLPRKGMVRTCRRGCVHLTYGAVTLDFHLPEFFQSLAEAVGESSEAPSGRMHVRHGHALLSFTPEEFAEFAGLVRQAAEELRRLIVVQRLLTQGCQS